MKSVLGLVLVLALSTVIWAQGGEGGEHCTFQASVQDNACDGNCPTSSTFSPNCDGDHWFDVKIWCLGLQECTIFRVTAYLYDTQSSSPISTIQNWGEEECGGCPDSVRVQLYTTHSYYLKVCLDPCYGHSCDECTSAGYVMARVYHL